ncbi:MAG: hypothetical protein EOP20_09840 [Hyphomicrobiales bacterium]|nr:MAG: hypothetical protein EOP20_09840 [Hyphomicrobiales bacterium]
MSDRKITTASPDGGSVPTMDCGSPPAAAGVATAGACAALCGATTTGRDIAGCCGGGESAKR